MAKPVDKMMEALSLFMEGYQEMQAKISEDHSSEDDELEEDNPEVESEIINQTRLALEGVIDGEDYSTEEIAAVIAHLMEAIQEIDPDVFDVDEEDSSDEDDPEEDDELLFDEDLEDLDSLDDDEEEDEDEDEDEDYK